MLEENDYFSARASLHELQLERERAFAKRPYKIHETLEGREPRSRGQT